MTLDDLKRLFTRQTLFRLDAILSPKLVPILYALGLAAILLWATGQAFGWQEAKAAAIAAFVMFVIAVAFVLGRSSYGVVLDLARTRVA